MTVIHSCTSNSFSGLESYVLELATWQYQRGKSVVLYCREESALQEKAIERGIPVWSIPKREKPGPRLWSAMASTWRKFSQAGDLALHMHAGGEPWFHLPWLLRRPRSLVKAVLHYHIWINHKKTDPLHRFLFLGLDEVWTSSETSRAHLTSLLPLRRERIRVVPYGRDVRGLMRLSKEKEGVEFRRQFGIATDEVLGVCISRIEKIKGVRELFEGFVKVASKCPKAQMIIVGEASPHNAESADYAEKLYSAREKLDPDLKKRLHFPGYVADCRPILAAADFYVLPSYEECMSLAMLDAAILGLPILGTDSGGTPSVVLPGETGVLVPPADADKLAQGLGGLYQDPELRSRLGQGAKVVGSRFDQQEVFERIWDCYEARPPSKLKA